MYSHQLSHQADTHWQIRPTCMPARHVASQALAQYIISTKKIRSKRRDKYRAIEATAAASRTKIDIPLTHLCWASTVVAAPAISCWGTVL